ncbi:heavy-metal-associated domain-containing protein [Pseudonocardia hydrocarbonoxydans]|uniref:Metal-binding protein n=1 Tax=Pseudonocardia hydrocarbonoxydans TaxID=76726 RepID=A0A4Y3WRQ0_9PSEU|nr:copper ion binding protein [Pseudonocardia hydrocarbonoxydans]GEC21188.1 metal-binding protein [Pseudonocardia hydrocarbonoxydans]
MAVEAPFRTHVTVTGMTCQHCVMSVTEEVTEIEGVSAVDVDLGSGRVTVLADRDVERGEIAAAVSEAGFELVG